MLGVFWFGLGALQLFSGSGVGIVGWGICTWVLIALLLIASG
jgi:hypothetical protein